MAHRSPESPGPVAAARDRRAPAPGPRMPPRAQRRKGSEGHQTARAVPTARWRASAARATGDYRVDARRLPRT